MASAALLIRNRYDVRAACLLWSMALRLVAIVIGASIGVTATFVAIVRRAGRRDRDRLRGRPVRAPAVSACESEPLGDHAKEIRSFAIQSTVASGCSRCAGCCRSCSSASSRPRRRSAYFRIAQAPQTAFASLSSPARMVLLAEQTRDIEHGRHDRAARLLRRYIGSAAGIVLVVVPLAWIWMESLIRIIYGARLRRRDGCRAADAPRRRAAAHLRLDEVVPRLDRAAGPADRSAQAIEIGVLVPLVLVLGALYGATGAAAASSARRLVLAAFWLVGLLRMRGRAARRRGRRRRVRVLIVSGIWPPDVGGPASHAPELAGCSCARAATRSRW